MTASPPAAFEFRDVSNHRPLRLAYVVQTGVPEMDVVSGPQLHIQAVVNELKRRGHAVRILMPQNGRLGWSDTLGGPEWTAARFGFSRKPLFRFVESPLRRIQYELQLPYLNLFDSIRFAEAACDALSGSDLIFERFGFMGYGGVLAASRLGIPAVLEVNGDILKEMDVLGVQLTPAQRRISKVITRMTLAAATGIVCVAAALKERLVETMKLDPGKIEVVANGADVSLFSQSADRCEIRKEFSLAARPTVIFVGSFQPWHAVDLLLEAFARVSHVTEAQLLLVGDGPGRPKAEERVQQSQFSNRVRFLGRVSNLNVARLLAVSDIAVVPFQYSNGEIPGSPLKIFEYMAAGCPTVCSWAPIHDTIEHEATGLRVRPADPAALAEGILRLLDDAELRQKLGARARQVAMERHSWEHTSARLEAFFQRVLAHSRCKTSS